VEGSKGDRLGKGKHFKTDKEHSRIQELSHKNKELQREIARLRRENERLRNQWVPPEELKVEENEMAQEAKPKKKDRTCYECGKGKLVMIKYGKPDGEWYYRSCDVCGYRTRSKKLTPEVEE